MDYTLPKYDEYRKNIKKARENRRSWEHILLGDPKMFKSIEEYMQHMRGLLYWDIDADDWKNLVNLEKDAEDKSRELEDIGESTILVDEETVSDIVVPTRPESAWQKYKEKLRKSGFREPSINEIEKSTLEILKRLQKDGSEVRKGLVMGNVQSGKTANMTALMAMAADWKWNMFIILSGTIENLRVQTQNRLLEDLGADSTINWRGIVDPSNHSQTDKTSDLNFTNNSAYFTVCLKNKRRLENLIKWLQHDQKKKRQMKVIVIDDEADQAGINTANVTTSQRKTINRLIVNLVNNVKHDGSTRGVNSDFGAMNYIGYTATPYANFLNETSSESLYPRDFIATLSNPPEYFGPQVIFGVEGEGNYESETQYDGLDIIRTVSKDNIEKIKSLHDGDLTEIPESLKDSIAWFLVGTAALRHGGYKKPLSMLIHTSHRQEHHQLLSDSIKSWVLNNKKTVMDLCRSVYFEESERVSKSYFLSAFKNYPYKDISDYPSFREIESEIVKLLEGVVNISLNDENELTYSEKIHLCVDNCANNGIDDEGMFKRLVYPNKSQLKEMKVAPAFIVVGGATLSRGLTLEGLISTFFLREGRQADTLMQMGRWFGYRRGYELYPRIWISDKTTDQFRFLSTLDFELRNEIMGMALRGVKPKEYGPRISNSPKVKQLKITAKNKMQSAVFTDMDYSGSHNQSVVFEDNDQVQVENILTTEEFLLSIGKPSYSREKTALVWREVSHFRIFEDFLYKFNFAPNNLVFSNLEGLYDWVDLITQEEKLGKWNVVVAGIRIDESASNLWQIGDFQVSKVTRTRRKTIGKKFDIGVLRAPRDVFADIDYEQLDTEKKSKLEKIKDTNFYEKRREAGLERIPQLLIYRIDKNSKVKHKSSTPVSRTDLNTNTDIIGICITIPGARDSSPYAKTITVKIDNTFEEDDYESD